MMKVYIWNRIFREKLLSAYSYGVSMYISYSYC